ncbi:peptide-methionine (S)-S-oxide reductase MsrA [Enemella sp. A6]|uniref:peptide-methionine (S)-S-oxide reductase MsrA n=1 Tax=Enemella sp. A6 TaxID=3440152 RepID=UPI003EB9B533
MEFFFRRPTPTMVGPDQALPGRDTPVLAPGLRHRVFDTAVDDTPAGSEIGYFALGCFWGEEQMFWQTPGVLNTAVGYQGGYTPNPTYEEVCTGRTGHAEAVRVCFDPQQVSYEQLVRMFFEAHDPTQGFRQGNDVGTQYRSALYTTSPDQAATAQRLREQYAEAYRRAGYGEITTEITEAPTWYYAEDYHQQYLIKNPGGYCPNHSTGVRCDPA